MRRTAPVGADVRSFIDMMSSLFQTSNVHLRELLQNALEATFQAERAGADASPILITAEASVTHRGILRITDCGIGMTGEELARNLGSVFFSGWPTEPGQTLGIGQFGFGFYTIFLVAEKVMVTSRALREPGRAHRWSLIRNEDQATMEELTGPLPPTGTLVEAHIDAASSITLNRDFILDNLRKQYLYVPYPVYVDGVPLGLPKADGWRRSISDRRAAAAASLRERWEWTDAPILVEPLALDNGGLLAVAPEGVRTPGVEVYRRGVRVTEQEIVPQPLNMFICGIVDMTEIKLKPDRESLRQDENFDRLQHAISDAANAMLVRAAEREPEVTRKIFDAHAEYLVPAMQRDSDLRKALGQHLPLPLYFPDRRSRSSYATLREMDLTEPRTGSGHQPGGRADKILQWAQDRSSDQLFADRARYLGATPVLLQDRRLYQLVRSICADNGITMRHVAINYLREVERRTQRDDALKALFRRVVGPEWELLFVEDVDVRLPLRFVVSPFADESGSAPLADLDLSSPEAMMTALISLFSRDEQAAEQVRLVVVNTRNDMIKDLRAALPTTPVPTQIQYAEIMVALAKFTAQTSMNVREFEKLNRDVLTVLHDRILEAPQPRRRVRRPKSRRF